LGKKTNNTSQPTIVAITTLAEDLAQLRGVLGLD
jgi:iron uptake system EfeUOB component EfeO/EfeM